MYVYKTCLQNTYAVLLCLKLTVFRRILFTGRSRNKCPVFSKHATKVIAAMVAEEKENQWEMESIIYGTKTFLAYILIEILQVFRKIISEICTLYKYRRHLYHLVLYFSVPLSAIILYFPRYYDIFILDHDSYLLVTC